MVGHDHHISQQIQPFIWSTVFEMKLCLKKALMCTIRHKKVDIADYITVLQIKKGNRDNLGIISHILHKNIFCDPSLEPLG